MNKNLRDTVALLQKKADLLDEKNRIEIELQKITPLIKASQEALLQSTCNHENFKEIYENTDNKYSGWGEYKCLSCGYTWQKSW